MHTMLLTFLGRHLRASPRRAWLCRPQRALTGTARAPAGLALACSQGAEVVGTASMSGRAARPMIRMIVLSVLAVSLLAVSLLAPAPTAAAHASSQRVWKE